MECIRLFVLPSWNWQARIDKGNFICMSHLGYNIGKLTIKPIFLLHLFPTKCFNIIWHEMCPDWVTFDDATELYRERIYHLIDNYGDDFDLTNETTVNERFDNPVSRWEKNSGK